MRQELENHLDEVILNALTHAASPIGCIVCGQAFPTSGTIEVAVVDFGVTILGHLRHNPRHASVSSHEGAILLATQEAVTGTVGRNRWGQLNSGEGLHRLRQYSESGGAEMTILSGNAMVTFGPTSEPITRPFREPGFEGTMVNIRFYARHEIASGGTGGVF